MPGTPSSGSRTILAFDFGQRRIGIAVGQEVTGTATPLTTLQCGDSGPDWDALARHVGEWQPALLVVGLPYNESGEPHPLVPHIRRFCRALRERFDLPVELVDERLTSAEAAGRLRDERRSGMRPRQVRKGDLDRVAAQLIAQSWLARSRD